MIPGSAAAVAAETVPAGCDVALGAQIPPAATNPDAFPHAAKWNLKEFLVPQPDVSDRFSLYRMVAADFLVVIVSCLACSLVLPDWGLRFAVIPAYAALVTLLGFSEGLYRDSCQARLPKLMAISERAVLFALALVFFAEQDQMPATALPVIFAGTLTALLLLRACTRAQARADSNLMDCRNVLIVGAGATGRAVARALRDDPGQSVVVRGFVDDHVSPVQDLLGGIEDLAWLARAEFIDEVILALPDRPARAREAADTARQNHLDIRAVLALPVDSRPGIERIGPFPVITLHKEALPSAGLFLKRVIDVAGAAVALALSGPLFLLLAVVIRLDSPGPVIYSAQRVGLKGKPFRCYKFRSMVEGADQRKEDLRVRNQRTGPIFKIENDPRATKVGRVLRRYSLDELPQLWNVLRGEMSLVGPRPHPVDEVNHYGLQHYRRLDVKPGITGLWQITARKNPSFNLNMHLDLTYIENWSVLLDLRILLRTMRVLIVPDGT